MTGGDAARCVMSSVRGAGAHDDVVSILGSEPGPERRRSTSQRVSQLKMYAASKRSAPERRVLST